MPTSRILVIVCEAIAALAVLMQFILPNGIDIGFRVSPQAHVGIPLRTVLPLLLIMLAGCLSVIALFRTGLELMHRVQ